MAVLLLPGVAVAVAAAALVIMLEALGRKPTTVLRAHNNNNVQVQLVQLLVQQLVQLLSPSHRSRVALLQQGISASTCTIQPVHEPHLQCLISGVGVVAAMHAVCDASSSYQ